MILKGKLTFISLWNPINLETEDSELDLRVQYFGLFRDLNGKKASMKYGMNDLTILADEESEYELEFEKSGDEIESTENDILGVILNKTGEGWGFSNVGAYLPDALERLNGMTVIVEIGDDFISIKHDETEEVHEKKFTHSNSCSVSDDEVKNVCKAGQEDCCIFLTAGGDGFMCEKFGNLGRTLLDRHDKGTMRASRIGNCKIVGRIEEKV